MLIGTTKITMISRETGYGHVAFRIPDAGSEETKDHRELVDDWLSELTPGMDYEGDDEGFVLHHGKDNATLGHPGDYIMFMTVPLEDGSTRILAGIYKAKDVGPMGGRKRYQSPDL